MLRFEQGLKMVLRFEGGGGGGGEAAVPNHNIGVRLHAVSFSRYRYIRSTTHVHNM